MTPPPADSLPIDTQSSAVDPTLTDKTVGTKAKKAKKHKVSKGVETLFRTTLSSHIKLSEMADRKANLMISINTIIISVVISAYARQLNAPANLLWPSILLLIVCLTTIVIALVATNPTITARPPKVTQPTDQAIDLLFFGQYTKLTVAEYRQQLRTLLTNEEDLYTSLINNIYAQGQVLSRKYRLLKLAYQLFMIGFSTVVLIVIILMCFTLTV